GCAARGHRARPRRCAGIDRPNRGHRTREDRARASRRRRLADRASRGRGDSGGAAHLVQPDAHGHLRGLVARRARRMSKPQNHKALWLVVPVLALVALTAVIPLMTVVNYSVQDSFGANQFFWVGDEWYRQT